MSGRTPVVFIHGLWLLASSWDRWAEHFAQAGYAPVSPGWPDDPNTVEEAIADPEAFADKTIGQVPITTRASSDSSAASRPSSATRLWQAATANFNPRTEDKSTRAIPTGGRC